METILVVFVPLLWRAAMKKADITSWVATAAFAVIAASAAAWCVGRVVFDYTQWFGN